MPLDAVEEQKVRVKYRSLLNDVIAFETQLTLEALRAEISSAKALVEHLERIDWLIKSMRDIPTDIPRLYYVSARLRWIARNGSEEQRAEAKAILALETRHRLRQI